MPRITVIIATFNWSAVLPFSIGSVLRQTYSDFELLVVGDGCTDDSEQVVKGMGDPRVRWINLPDNTRHQSGPNNEGLRQASGEYIAYLGHDDLWLPHHLDVAMAEFARTGADLTYSIASNVAPDGAFVWPTLPDPATGTFASPLSVVHRKRMTNEIGGWRDYRELKTITPDVELWRRAHAAGYHFSFVRRLTGIKFAAGHRRNVYAIKPSHEQALWSARIQNEPDFEIGQLVDFAVGKAVPNGIPYRTLVRTLLRQTAARIRKHRAGVARWPGLLNQRSSVDEVRRFKGL